MSQNPGFWHILTPNFQYDVPLWHKEKEAYPNGSSHVNIRKSEGYGQFETDSKEPDAELSYTITSRELVKQVPR